MSDNFHCFCPCGNCEDFKHCHGKECDAPADHAHANGARSCIAHALGGGEDADDFWYKQARDVLEALKGKGFVVVKAEGKL